MAREAVSFLEQHQAGPFYLNYWMFSVHAPFDAKQALIEKYRARVNPADPQRSPTYAAMIESMDDAVGTLLDTLDRLRLADTRAVTPVRNPAFTPGAYHRADEGRQKSDPKKKSMAKQTKS